MMTIKQVLTSPYNEVTLTKQEFKDCLEEQKVLTSITMLNLMEAEVSAQYDINWQQGLLETIQKYKDMING